MIGSKLFRQYFGSGLRATPDEAGRQMWNDGVGPQDYTEANDKYQATILDQYKLCVEMADRISARRALANTFFFSLNAAILTVIGVSWKDPPSVSVWSLAAPLITLLLLCLVWYWLVRSYRQLNSGKHAVIGALERRLPASPFWRGEWVALGEGRDKLRYWPLTHLEQWVPCLFAVTYLLSFFVILFAEGK